MIASVGENRFELRFIPVCSSFNTLTNSAKTVERHFSNRTSCGMEIKMYLCRLRGGIKQDIGGLLFISNREMILEKIYRCGRFDYENKLL